MSARSRVNQVLAKATGYRLVRAGSVPPPVEKAVARRTPPRKRPKRQGIPIPSDYDQETKEIWRAVRSRTMTHHLRVHMLIQAVRYVERNRIAGAMVECGVWRGGSMLAVAHTLLRLGVTDRELYLFDTFEGMTAPTDRDIRIARGRSAETLLSGTRGGPMAWARPENWVATLDDVQAGFAEIDYPAGRVHFVPGPVEQTVPGHAPEEIAILRLDTDWYESTRHELDHLYKRLAPGGVLIIDDYGTWQGSKEATDEFLAATGEPLMLTRVAKAAVAVKPGLASRV